MLELFAVLAHGPERDKLQTALQIAILKAEEHSAPITIIVPTLKNAPNTILSKVIGEKLVRDMLKEKLSALNGIPVSIKSIKTFAQDTQKEIIVALWGGEKMLKKLEQCMSSKSIKTIIVLSWNSEEVEPWCEKHMVKIVEI